MSRRDAAACDRLARRRGVSVLRTAPALLEIPAFRRSVPRLSEYVAAEHRPDGDARAGSMERAFARWPQSSAADASTAVDRLVQGRLGGSYWADAPSDSLLAERGAGLAIVVAGGAEAACRAMLTVAFCRVGAARTLLLLGTARPAGLLRFAARAGCRVAAGAVDPWPLLDSAAELHVAGPDRLGMLACLTGIDVHCHGPAWFSGPGSVTQRGRLATAMLVDGAWYTDPFTASRCTVDRAFDLAAEWRRVCDANRSIAACVGMQIWKRRRIRQFLHTGVRAPRLLRSARAAVAAARPNGVVAGWASRLPAALTPQAAEAGVSVVRVEDGFLRSVGLGSDFLPPCSIVLDRSGLYYDPTRPSDLETLLETAAFPQQTLARAAALIAQVTQAGLTKYNTGASSLPALPADRTLILVPGQVADDLSVRLGGGLAGGNAELLRRVRQANPGAFILYRPHPDVDAGHRAGAIPDSDALRFADVVVRGTPMGALIGAVDELHTMTSLAGFEALLRGRRVVVWGRPFYAGWGLTTDMAALPRRTRRLSVEALAAGVLLLYPRYLDPVTLLPCPAEVVVDRLATPGIWRPGALVRLRRWQGQVAKRWATLAASKVAQP